MSKLKVFLCHSKQDKEFVRGLYKDLKDQGMAPWLDEEDLLPGQNWDSEIRRVIKSADCIVVCLSKNAVSKSGYYHKEIKFALDVAYEKPEDEIFLIPAKVEECEIPDRLSHLHTPDIFTVKGHTQLVNALKVRASKLKQPEKSQTDSKETAKLFDELKKYVYFHFKQSRNIVTVIGRRSVGKTALTYLLAKEDYNFLVDRQQSIRDSLFYMNMSDPSMSNNIYKIDIKKQLYMLDIDIESFFEGATVDFPVYNIIYDRIQQLSSLVFFVTSCDHEINEEDVLAIENLRRRKRLVLLLNKIDLLSDYTVDLKVKELHAKTGVPVIPISVIERKNIDTFKQLIYRAAAYYDSNKLPGRCSKNKCR